MRYDVNQEVRDRQRSFLYAAGTFALAAIALFGANGKSDKLIQNSNPHRESSNPVAIEKSGYLFRCDKIGSNFVKLVTKSHPVEIKIPVQTNAIGSVQYTFSELNTGEIYVEYNDSKENQLITVSELTPPSDGLLIGTSVDDDYAVAIRLKSMPNPSEINGHTTSVSAECMNVTDLRNLSSSLSNKIIGHIVDKAPQTDTQRP